MGRNWEQLPRPPIEGAYVDEDYPPPEKSHAEKRAEEKAEARAKLRAERRNRPDSTPDSEEEEEEYLEEQRKQAERRRINKANRPPKEKRVDHAKVARAAHDRRMLDTTLPSKQLSEDDYRDRIMEIVGQPATKWTPTKSDMQTYCRALSVDPHGDVTSRLVSFMERVDDVIDENGLRQQLKDSTILRTFVKVVAARVTPSYLRDRVEEQMKTVPANDLVALTDILREQLDRTHDADMVNQQRNSYGSKRGREEDDQGRRITKHAKKANQAVRDQRELRGNYPRPPGGYFKPERSAAVWSPSTQKRTGDPPATKYGPQANSCPRHDDRHTAAGPAKVPGKRRCYVVNDGDEFLVSDDTLKTIGIDIDRLLEQVARLQVDEDGDDLEEVGGDCVELPQRSAVRAATMKAMLPVAKNEVEEALQGMIGGAVDNGFPMEHVEYLWDVLSKHDIWRIKFDGQTHRRRKHNLLEERFLKLFAQELLDAGVIKSNQQSAWCSPVNPVLKPDGRKSLKSAD
ncbi:hypothetical protein DYB26_014853, partial [Aphanomyces astaci]